MPWIFPSSVLGGCGGSAGEASGIVLEPVAAHAVGAGFEKIPLSMGTPGTHRPPAPAQGRSHNSLLPLSPSLWLLQPSRSFAQPVPGPLYLEPAQAWCSKRAMLSSGQRLKTPLDLLFPFPSGAFLPIRCLLLVWEQPASCRYPWCGCWADEILRGRSLE